MESAFLPPIHSLYSPRGIGGGGAMAGFSISPYAPLRFVGTDMGTLFRSIDGGRTWQTVNHQETTFSSDLEHAAPVGFTSNPLLVFHAPAGQHPQRSDDAGITWAPMALATTPSERIRYWVSDHRDPLHALAATSQGLWRTTDAGLTWTRAPGSEGESAGTFFLNDAAAPVIYHATADAIVISRDRGATFSPWFKAPGRIRSFAGGQNAAGLTLAFIDGDGERACAWAEEARTKAECGFVWTKRGGDALTADFAVTPKFGGLHVRMADNDPTTLYVTGGHWEKQLGSQVWVSHDAGGAWERKLLVYDWSSEPYLPWAKDRLEYSAVGLDVGWDDNAYSSFAVNALDSREAGGTGYYFLHVTRDAGEHWAAPFTQFADEGERVRGKRWKSTGLEVTSVMKLKFHPRDAKVGYAALADMGGLVTEDGGESWRVSKAHYNTNYDYAFDPSDLNLVYAASGEVHDYPMSGWQPPQAYLGAILRSKDRGRHWERLTPENPQWNHQFLSVAYDPLHRVIYGGMQGLGVARSRDDGKTWEACNDGLPPTVKVIPQIEIDPANGNAYALLAGDPPTHSNNKVTGLYFLDVSAASPKWVLLRGQVNRPAEVSAQYAMWWFPTAFAVDWSRPARDVIWLADYEAKGSWLASGVWKTIDRGQAWNRATQFTHPTQLTLDPANPDALYVSGLYQADGGWGAGGAIYSVDGGRTWKKNPNLPLLENLYGTALDPASPENVFYLFFGGGMLHGPKPK